MWTRVRVFNLAVGLAFDGFKRCSEAQIANDYFRDRRRRVVVLAPLPTPLTRRAAERPAFGHPTNQV